MTIPADGIEIPDVSPASAANRAITIGELEIRLPSGYAVAIDHARWDTSRVPPECDELTLSFTRRNKDRVHIPTATAGHHCRQGESHS
ncbi:MAG: hypothetical protein ACR2JC_20845 [Chloroflexota bacterium]